MLDFKFICVFLCRKFNQCKSLTNLMLVKDLILYEFLFRKYLSDFLNKISIFGITIPLSQLIL